MTLDKILTSLIHLHYDDIKLFLSARDFKAIKGIHQAILSPVYITENQARLVVKIINANLENFKNIISDIDQYVENPVWEKSFRKIEKHRKLKLLTNSSGEEFLDIDYTFSAEIKKKILEIKNLCVTSSHPWSETGPIDFTEKNIVTCVDRLKPLNFEIDENVKKYHEIIKSWSKDEIENQFNITSMTNANFQRLITDDLGDEVVLTKELIHDRSVRYNYIYEKNEKNPENLREKVAMRSSPQIWINRKETELDEILNILKDLYRFPLLVVFDGHDSNRCLQDLKKFTKILEKIGIFEDVGIYFRLNNDEVGKEFNSIIADKKYNAPLNKYTKIAGVQNGKIPKFFLKEGWKPMSVIGFGNPIKNNKTAVYVSCCDLIISYTDTEPLSKENTVWR